jgi:putative FmdB family regulatory protein
MPTYEYKCDACGFAFEKFQSIMAKPIKKCPNCGKNKVKRLISAGAGLIFKGSGFYITDYRSEGYKNSAKADTAAPAAADTKPAGDTKAGGETKTESKPATEAKPAATEPKPKHAEKSAAKSDSSHSSKSSKKKD